VATRDVRQRTKVDQAKCHRAGTLHPDQPCGRGQGALDAGGIERERKRVRDAERRQPLGELQGRTVRLVDEQDVVAGLEQAEHHCADGRHAGAEQLARLAVLERRQFALGGFYGGVLTTRVDVHLVFTREGVEQLVERVEREQRRDNDRRRRRSAACRRRRRIVRKTESDVSGIEMHLCGSCVDIVVVLTPRGKH
jgi:hypothetical protein